LPFEDENTAKLYKKIIKGNYKVPKHSSEEAKDFLRKLLTTNPDERIDIESIKEHPWYLLCDPDLLPDWASIEQTVHLNAEILADLENYGFNKDYV
jgi:serine/threonine protein kinase